MDLIFLQKKPFFIFEIQDFLTDFEYEVLNKNFPDPTNQNLTISKVNKNSFYSYDSFYKDLKDNNNKCIELLEEKFNEVFFLKLSKKLQKELFISRMSKISNIFSLLRKFKITKKHENKNFFQKLFYSYFRYTFGFSYMFKDSYIPPHNDSPSKLISLMLYFPSKELENLDIGTTFYKSNFKNFKNVQPDFFQDENLSFFKKNFKETITLPFKKKNLYCFIKSDLSWHSVKKLDIPDNQTRKSININLNI